MVREELHDTQPTPVPDFSELLDPDGDPTDPLEALRSAAAGSGLPGVEDRVDTEKVVAAGFAIVDAAQMASIVKSEAPVYDVRDKAGFSGDLGHILGAQRIDRGDLLAIGKAVSPQTEIVLICRDGSRSAELAAELADLGLEAVMVLSGGMVAWNRQGLPVRLSKRALARPESRTGS